MIALLAREPDSLGVLIYVFPTVIALILIGVGAVKFFKNHEVSINTIMKVAQAFYYNKSINEFIKAQLNNISYFYENKDDIDNNITDIYIALLNSLKHYLDGIYSATQETIDTDEDMAEIYSELEKYKVPLSQIEVLSRQILLALGYDDNKIKSYIRKLVMDRKKEDDDNGNKKDLSRDSNEDTSS